MTDHDDDELFDARMRAILRGLPVAEAPLAMPRRHFLRQGLALAAGLSAVSVGAWIGWQYADTPPLIRAAFRHMEEEAYVRGVLVADLAQVKQSIGLSPGAAFPGSLQLCKDCVVAGLPAWHLNFYVEDAGYVHLLAFRRPIPPLPAGGHGLPGYWRVLAEKTPILLLSKNSHALAKIQAAFA